MEDRERNHIIESWRLFGILMIWIKTDDLQRLEPLGGKVLTIARRERIPKSLGLCYTHENKGYTSQ